MAADVGLLNCYVGPPISHYHPPGCCDLRAGSTFRSNSHPEAGLNDVNRQPLQGAASGLRSDVYGFQIHESWFKGAGSRTEYPELLSRHVG